MSFGENLKYLMRERRVSGEALGEIVGKKKSAISSWVNNNTSPSINDLILIRNYFKIDLDNLIVGSLKKTEFLKSSDISNLEIHEPSAPYQAMREVIVYLEKECRLTGSKCAFDLLPELKAENELLRKENEALKKK